MMTSTPLCCRAALFRGHAPYGRFPLNGPWSIGLLRINRRLLAGVSHRVSFAAAHAQVSNRARTRRGRVPSKLMLAVLHAGLLSPKELRFGPRAADTGILLRHRQALGHSVSNSRRADSSTNGDAQSIGEAQPVNV